jgi:hypothetical protein
MQTGRDSTGERRIGIIRTLGRPSDMEFMTILDNLPKLLSK